MERTQRTHCNISLKTSLSLKQLGIPKPEEKMVLEVESGIIWLLDKKKSRGKIKHSDLAQLIFQRSKCFVAINQNDYFLCLLLLRRAK